PHHGDPVLEPGRPGERDPDEGAGEVLPDPEAPAALEPLEARGAEPAGDPAVRRPRHGAPRPAPPRAGGGRVHLQAGPRTGAPARTFHRGPRGGRDVRRVPDHGRAPDAGGDPVDYGPPEEGHREDVQRPPEGTRAAGAAVEA